MKEIKQPEKFTFWYPAELVKAKDKEGKSVMRMGGIASTIDKDSDGEFLDPTGFDLKPFLEKGTINWHHQTRKSPSAIVGEPFKAQITKKGLYLEADLYKSSEVAQEIYKTAQVLEKDSKTRRLGFSIEGSVLERGSEDKTDPEYYNVKKAVITGCAITHMPKNPKTFANIIKGEGADIEEGEEEIEKSEDSYRIVEGTEEEMIEIIKSHYAGINLEKAKQINLIFNKIKSEMKKGKTLNDDSIEKALANLGLTEADTNIIEKADNTSDEEEETAKPKKKEPISKAKKKEEETDEEEEEEKPKKKVEKAKKGDDEEEEEKPKKKVEKAKDDEEEEEEEEKPKKKEIKKSTTKSDLEKAKRDLNVDDEEEETEKGTETKKLSAFEKIEKAISDGNDNTNGLIRSLARLTKASMDEIALVKGELAETKDSLEKANTTLEEMINQVPERKSTLKPRDKNFEKGEQEEELAKYKGKTVIKKSERARVLEVLDNATFEKGLDNEFSKAMTSFESTGNLSESIISRLAIEKNVVIINK